MNKQEVEFQPEQAKKSLERWAYRINRMDVLMRKQHKHLQELAKEVKEIYETLNN